MAGGGASDGTEASSPDRPPEFVARHQPQGRQDKRGLTFGVDSPISSRESGPLLRWTLLYSMADQQRYFADMYDAASKFYDRKYLVLTRITASIEKRKKFIVMLIFELLMK